MSGAAKVTIQERDLSTTVPSFPGVYGCVVLPQGYRGDVESAVLCTTEGDFLSRYTINDRIGVGYDLAYYSAVNFLQKSNKLWVIRAVNGALTGAIVVQKASYEGAVIKPVDSGIEDINTYVFTTSDLFLLYGINPGAWNNGISIKIDRNTKEDPANFPFVIYVYHLGVLKETHVVSRVREAKDGYGRGMYIEDVLQRSGYIRALDNVSIPVEELPKTTEPTTVSFSKAVVQQAYQEARAGVAKQQSFSVAQGNTTGRDITYTLAGVDVNIPLSAVTPDQVASAISAGVYTANNNIDVVSSVSNVVTVTSKVTAGDWDLGALPIPHTIRTSSYSVEQVAAASTPKIISFLVLNPNQSGVVEEFELAGVTVNVAASATTNNAVALAIAGADYSGVTTIDTVVAEGNKVTITFTVAAGDAPAPSKTIPSTIITSGVSVTRSYSAPRAEQAQIQTLTVLTANTSSSTEVVKVGGVSVPLSVNEDTVEEVAAKIAAADFSVNGDIQSANAVGGTVLFTMKTSSKSAPLVEVDDGSKPYGIYLEKGYDGAPVSDSDMIRALDKIRSLPCTLLLDGGRATPGYQKAMITMAERRMDCVAILSCPYSAETSSDYLNEVIRYREETLNANTSYAALYTPHVKITDKFNDREIFVSPDGFVGAVISQTAAQYELWYPAAGFRRGVINVLDCARRYEEGEMDYLYEQGINPIWFSKGRGIVIWGQKTLLNKPSTLNRLSARLLLIVIEPAIKEALEDYLFEQNTAATRLEVKTLIDSYMEDIRSRGGVYDFYTVCDESNNSDNDIENNRMNVWLFIKPTQSAEYIRFVPVVTRYGVDFADVFGRV